MPAAPPNSAQVDLPTEARPGIRGLSGVLVAAAALLVATMVYLYQTASRLEATHTPWVDSINEVQLQLTTGHLWLEEILSGDRDEEIATVLELYASGQQHTKLLLHGGPGKFGQVLPVADAVLERQTGELSALIEAFTDTTHLRIQQTLTAGAGTPIDADYDRQFRNIIDLSQQMHSHVEVLIAEGRRHFRTVQLGAIFGCVGLLGLLGLTYRRFERQRSAATEALLLAKAEAEKSGSRYRSLVENIQLGITLIDTEYRVVTTNDAQAALFRRDPGEFVGRHCYSEFEDREEPCPHCPGRKAMESGIAQAAETAGVRPDGSTFPVRILAFPVIDSAGTATGFIEVVEDISESRRMEEDLRFKSFAIDRASSMAMWTDATGRFTYVNDAACSTLGYSREELLALRVSDIDPQTSEERWPEIWDALQRRGILTFESIARTKAGPVIPVEVKANHVEFRGTEYNCAFVQDLSERRRKEEEDRKMGERLLHLQKLESMGVLAGGIAHDFNNILMGVLGNAELALDKLPPESPARDSLIRIEGAAKSAADLASQMLAYSGKGRFQVQAVRLDRVVEETSHLLESAVSKKCVVKYDFADNLPAIEADITQVRQVLLNLVTNASEAVGTRSGVITVSTGVMEADRAYLAETYLDEDLQEGYYAYVEVADTGGGMDAGTRGRVFDPFFSTKFTGRGLGLAAVLGIVRGHRGAIKVYSEPGRGTTFKVLFPCPERALEPEPSADTGAAMTTPEKDVGGLVLVVDDEEPVRTVAKMGLEQAGFQVLIAEDGRKGLEVFRARADDIAVVVLDMTMPHMSGEEAFREIRRIRGDVPILLSSGYNEQEATGRFAGKGLAGFLHKPYRPSRLISEVRRVIAAEIGN